MASGGCVAPRNLPCSSHEITFAPVPFQPPCSSPRLLEEATSLSYGYSLEFDKSQTLQDITREQKARVRSEFIENSKRVIRGKTTK
ncbi:MAG: hypothetical protein ABGZ49_00855 [Akkermansiaceae bacterium]